MYISISPKCKKQWFVLPVMVQVFINMITKVRDTDVTNRNTLENLFGFLVSRPRKEQETSDRHELPEFAKPQKSVNPFTDICSTDLFLPLKNHRIVVEEVMQAVQHDLAMAQILAPVGMGKTLIAKFVKEQLDQDENLKLAFATATPNMTTAAMLKEILQALGYEIVVTEKKFAVYELFKLLEQYVTHLNETGKKLIVILDEVQYLTSGAIQMVKRITSIETNDIKLATFVLVGEESVERRLAHQSFESLRSRIFYSTKLTPLTAVETRSFVQSRLKRNNWSTDVFSEADQQEIYFKSRGICREINKYAYQLLNRKGLLQSDIMEGGRSLIAIN